MRHMLMPAFSIVLMLGGGTASPQRTENASVPSGGTAAGTTTPSLTRERHPQYRLRKSDVIELHFTFSPEYDQTLTVQPDGFVALKGVPAILAEGLTSTELQDAVRRTYQSILRDPEISVILKEFEKPFFIAGGQLGKPGKYELRSPTTVSEAIAIAGGLTDRAKHSEVLLFRKASHGMVEARVLNLKRMLARRNLEEDTELKPGDMLYVPQNRISKIRQFLPASSLNTYFSPTQF